MEETFFWPTLRPLEECVVAKLTLANLGVEATFWTGWAQIGLAVTTVIQAARPGASISLKQKLGSFRISFSGGVSYQPYMSFMDELSGFADGLASVTCETCGRPGEARSDPIGVFCETDYRLRTGYEPIPPQMPYLPEIVPAAVELARRGLLGVPTGWSQLAYEVVRARERSGLPLSGEFVDCGDRLQLYGPQPDEHFRRLQDEVESSSALTCRRCGRELDDQTPPAGMCAGCLWLNTRGQEIVPGIQA